MKGIILAGGSGTRLYPLTKVTSKGITISAPEEVAYINGFIDKDKLMQSAKSYGKSPYGEHLMAVVEENSDINCLIRLYSSILIGVNT